MNATATPGVWMQEILPGINMICYTQINLITVSNTDGSNVRYHCPDGIKLTDIEQIQDSIIRTTMDKMAKV